MGVPSFSLIGLGSVSGSYPDFLLFRLSLSGRLATLGCDHHDLRGCPDIILQR